MIILIMIIMMMLKIMMMMMMVMMREFQEQESVPGNPLGCCGAIRGLQLAGYDISSRGAAGPCEGAEFSVS